MPKLEELKETIELMQKMTQVFTGREGSSPTSIFATKSESHGEGLEERAMATEVALELIKAALLGSSETTTLGAHLDKLSLYANLIQQAAREKTNEN